MKKKTNIRTVIRQIVREEVAMAIQEVITELKQPVQQQISKPKQRKKVVEKKTYSNNSVLNDVLNETAGEEEWKTMGGGTYDSGRAGEILASSYGDMMNGAVKPSGDQMVASMGVNPEKVPDDVKNAIGRDYSELMKKINKK
tara:strand:+ start:108 stop:533 length:426 start_codon:yes stop_codon:yes gene_type:complete